jgi:hypothetical protein
MLKAVLAVVAGIISIGILATGLDFLVTHLLPGEYGPTPGEVRSTWMLFVVMGYSLVACAWGAYISAAIAPERVNVTSVVLAALMSVATAVNEFVQPVKLPLWWKIACPILEAPAILFGARLYARFTRTRARSVA